MPAQYIYKVSTSSNVDMSARVRADTTSMTQFAEQGSVAIPSVVIDDDDAGINIVGLHQFDWKESSESSNSRTIFRGFVNDVTVTRGQSNRVGASRQWLLNVSDINSLIPRRIMLGADANRPAETDIARVQWLMGTNEFAAITDSSLINTSGAVHMDANDYRNQSCQQILDDCSQDSGKNFFIWLNEIPATPTYGLFYDFASSTAYTSTIRLSNVLSDVDSSTTFAVSEADTRLNRDWSRVYSGAVEPYVGGQVYVQSDAIANAFARRDTMAPAVNVHTAATATARAIRYINDAATPDDRITTSYQVPLAKVNRLMPGMLVLARFSHLPGYESPTWCRALNRTVTAMSEEFYKVEVELSPEPNVALPTGPPAPAFATLEFTHGLYTLTGSTWSVAAAGSDSSAYVCYAGTGSAPPGGCASIPLVGALAYEPQFSAGGFTAYPGIIVTGMGTLDMSATTDINAVVTGTVTTSLKILVNGAQVGIGSNTDSGGLRGYGPTLTATVAGVPVSPGDIIRTSLSWLGMGQPVCPGGSGDCTYSLTVSGSLAP